MLLFLSMREFSAAQIAQVWKKGNEDHSNPVQGNGWDKEVTCKRNTGDQSFQSPSIINIIFPSVIQSEIPNETVTSCMEPHGSVAGIV